MEKGNSATRAKNKYKNKSYDRIEIVVPKGEKATIEAAAKADGESVNGYTNKALLEKMGLQQWPSKQEDTD